MLIRHLLSVGERDARSPLHKLSPELLRQLVQIRSSYWLERAAAKVVDELRSRPLRAKF